MMTTINIRRGVGARAARYATFGLLALFAVLCQSRPAQAQWVTQGTNTTTTGNVGIGTATPGAGLQVSTATTANGRGIIDEQSSNDGLFASFAFMKSRVGGAVANGDGIGSIFAAASDGSTYLSPTHVRFFVDGPVSTGSIPTAVQFFTGSTGGGVERLRISSAGNVGIATTNPLAPIHVATATASGGVAFFQKDGSSSGIGIGTFNNLGAISGVNSTYTAAADLLVNPTGGNVGIGTTAPATKLHIVGDVTVTGNIAAKYQDVAEWVPTLHALPAGTVVVLDITRDNHVTSSTSSYDTRVAGVVSAHPGLSLGEAGEGKALVATTGRVKVKVDATHGTISIGDLLVTSDRAGYAMKSEPLMIGRRQFHSPGTIIGKALEPLAGGTGEILVLLSLQ